MGLFTRLKDWDDGDTLYEADLEAEFDNLYDQIVAATTSAVGMVQLEDSVTSTSVTKAATPKSVKAAYDNASAGSVSDTVYSGDWDGVTTIAPSKNAVYDKIETIGSGGVDTFGTPVDNDFAKFTDANTIEGRSKTETLSDLNVEDGATKYPDTGEQAFLDADHTKLDGIATAATKYPDTGEQAFLDGDHTKLNGIEGSATADQTKTDIDGLGCSHDSLSDVSADDHHAQSHNAASHSDITASGANIDDAVDKKHAATLIGTKTIDETDIANTKVIAYNSVSGNLEYESAGTPDAHKTTHENGGADEISVTGLSGLLADDQHVLDAEVLAVAAAKGANSDITSLSGLTTDLSIAQGGTGQSTAQTAINALSAVSGATNEHVLTKDTGTGNAIFKASSGGGGGGLSWEVISANANAVNGSGYLINASGGNITLTLPASPGAGHIIGVCDVYNKATTNTITISRNSSNIESIAENLIVNIDGAGFTLVFTDTTRGWEIVTEIGGSGSSSVSDAVYGVGWNGVTGIAPSKNAVYDKIETLGGGGAPDAHKDSHDPADGSDPLDTAAPSELASVQAAGTGSSHSFARADHQHQIQHGIADNHIVTIDHAAVADNDYAKFTANGLEGRSKTEMLSDLNVVDGATKYPDTGEQVFLDADHTKLDAIEAEADITDATNVNAAGAVMESDYNANTFLYAVDNDTPVVKTRAETLALLSGQANASFDMNSQAITKLSNVVTTHTPGAAGTATLDLDVSRIHDITMPAGNITIAISNEDNGNIFTIRILQDGTGNRTVTWFSTIKWAGGSAPTLTTTANKADTVIFRVTGTDTYDGFVVGKNI